MQGYAPLFAVLFIMEWKLPVLCVDIKGCWKKTLCLWGIVLFPTSLIAAVLFLKQHALKNLGLMKARPRPLTSFISTILMLSSSLEEMALIVGHMGCMRNLVFLRSVFQVPLIMI